MTLTKQKNKAYRLKQKNIYILENGAEVNQHRFFIYGIRNSIIVIFTLFFSIFNLYSEPDLSDGTRIANSYKVSSEIQQDSVFKNSGIINSYSESNDVYVAEVFVKDGQSISEVSIFNMLGKKVESVRPSNRALIEDNETGKIYSYRLNSSRLTPGMYIIAVEGTDFKDVERFVKSR